MMSASFSLLWPNASNVAGAIQLFCGGSAAPTPVSGGTSTTVNVFTPYSAPRSATSMRVVPIQGSQGTAVSVLTPLPFPFTGITTTLDPVTCATILANTPAQLAALRQPHLGHVGRLLHPRRQRSDRRAERRHLHRADRRERQPADLHPQLVRVERLVEHWRDAAQRAGADGGGVHHSR